MATSNDTTPKKTCTKCGVEYPATEEYFQPRHDRTGGLRAYCRECLRIQKATYYSVNREKIRAYQNAYTAEHAEAHRAYNAIYRNEHREQVRAYQAARYIKHRQSVLQRVTLYRREHPDKIIAYRQTHHAEMLAYNKARRLTPEGKEAHRIYSHNRRALTHINGCDKITQAEYAEVLKAHTNKRGQIICAWCGKPIEKDWHYDHWIPLDKGGRHEAGNLRVMHGLEGDKCNLRKHATHPFRLGRLI